MEIVTMNEKGQVTIPLKIRKSKGLKKGMKVALIEIGERIELVTMPEDLVQCMTGLGKKLPSIEDIEAEVDVE